MNLPKQDEKLSRFTSSQYICHTKAMTVLVQYGTRCLYWATNFYSVLIVRSASWLQLKSSIFENAAKTTLSVTVYDKVVPRLNKHDGDIEWNIIKTTPPPKWRAGRAPAWRSRQLQTNKRFLCKLESVREHLPVFWVSCDVVVTNHVNL